jgi:predicted DNA-binding transcriptional regulator YafY
LTVLELLQSHQRLTGPELAARLEVNTRTARRYITMLQDMGIPIEAERGRYGAYRLRPGFTLPPLMFSEDEALAVTLGLLAARRLGLAATAPAVEGALAKIERALPKRLSERLQAVQAALVLDLARAEPGAEADVVLELSGAAYANRSVWMHYRADSGATTERQFDPYGIVYRQGRWYTVGYCHLRRDLRMFRLDRVTALRELEHQFTRPPDFDCAAYVVHSLATMPNTWQIEVVLAASLEEARRRFPPIFGTLEATEEGVILRAHVEDLQWLARDLIAAGIPLRVIHPPALRDALRAIADQVLASV